MSSHAACFLKSNYIHCSVYSEHASLAPQGQLLGQGKRGHLFSPFLFLAALSDPRMQRHSVVKINLSLLRY